MKEFKLQLIVLLQQVFLFLFLVQWPFSLPWWGYFLLVLFSIPALFALHAQRHQFRISPRPKEGAQLITYGPYRFVRHPMYFSLMCGLLVPLLWEPNIWRSLTYGVLVVVIILKVFAEERLLQRKFTHYREYQKKTKRLIPFLF